MEDDLGLAGDFDNIHLAKRFKNALVAGSIVIGDVPLQYNMLVNRGAQVGIRMDDIIHCGFRDRQKMSIVYVFMEKRAAFGTALAAHRSLPRQLRSVANDVHLLGRLLQTWLQANFDLYLDEVAALLKYLSFHMAVFFLQKERNAFNKVPATLCPEIMCMSCEFTYLGKCHTVT